jgi:thiol-disulfide isomerase/thioredoxin
MKNPGLIILNLFIAQLLFAQPIQAQETKTDPFCRMIKTIYSLDALSFNSQHNIKQVFETDTITTYAKVIVKKKGTTISFLQIIPQEGDQELLFFHDSAWVVNHSKKSMFCIGTNIDQLTYNYLSQFFSFTLFNIDTTISQVEPFWKIIAQTKEHTVISIDITNSSKDLSDIRAEFTIGNADFLPYKTLQESVYLKADKLFQEQIFSEYSFPEQDQIKVPEYFTKYDKDFNKVQEIDSVIENKAEESLGEVFLQDIELFDLARNPVSLPDKGLILFDLWYVGCPPCMKSAPVIEKLYIEYKARVHFFSVNETDRDTAKIARFKDMMGITFPVLLGGKEKLALKVNGKGGYPVFILMDARSGKLLWKLEGYAENLEKLIKDAIDQNL